MGIRKSIGPRTEPCGAPVCAVSFLSESTMPIMLVVLKTVSQVVFKPTTTVCHTLRHVSNAFFRSMNIERVKSGSLLFAATAFRNESKGWW